MPEKKKILEVKHLKQYFKNGRNVTKAVDDVSFDIYEGEQVKKGYKSVAYSLSFRAKDRTLEEADINAALKKILNGLEQLGIELRQ